MPSVGLAGRVLDRLAGARAGAFGAAAGRALRRVALRQALAAEWEDRRFFLWAPVALGAGVCLYFAAEREPVLWLPLVLGLLLAGAMRGARDRPALFCGLCGLLLTVLGFVAAELRSARVAAPVLAGPRIMALSGTIEQVDPREQGARFILRIDEAARRPGDPQRVRLGTRREEPLRAGDHVRLMGRLLPPGHAVLPGGYDFARDAWFGGIGGVGTVLGRVAPVPADGPPPWGDRLVMALDRARNALADRVSAAVGGGDVGAIAAAMVTGKRDRLSADGKDVIREAGIFHIITIAGVQMTLVAGLIYGVSRRLMALSTRLALRCPIKQWAAALAIAGAVAYDLGTGSRIGTQRALLMTGLVFLAVLTGRRVVTMRSLALAAFMVLAVEPEALLGASFQLSFAAVAALVAVQEARRRRRLRVDDLAAPRRPPPRGTGILRILEALRDKVVGLFIATLAASGATAAFMAADFHEISPYVLVGNPLTLTMIEVFAVPGALIGTVLYPLGLDGVVWQWVALGIRLVLWMARGIAALPGATLHVPAFAPWALPCFALGIAGLVIFRPAVLRLACAAFIVLGLTATVPRPRPALFIAPSGTTIAIRGDEGRLALLGKSDAFAAEQWLRADGDGRPVGTLVGSLTEPGASRCDRLACISPLPEGQVLSLVTVPDAFEEDCRRADVVVTSLLAPENCAAPLVVDRDSLDQHGALALRLVNGGWVLEGERSEGYDRPWWPAPRPHLPRREPADGEDTGLGTGVEAP